MHESDTTSVVAENATTQTTKRPISHARFSMLASYIASNAASWAGDCLTLPEDVDRPMTQDALDRFTAKIEGLLGAINGR